MQGNSGLPGEIVFRPAPIGAGGFVIGMDISADGSRMVHWTDVFNGYIRDAGADQWQLLLRPDNFPASEYDPMPTTPTTDAGVYAARIAPSNRDVIYCSFNGFIYRTADGGRGWARTGFTPRYQMSNLGAQRRFNRTIDVHPTDPDTLIVGTNSDGAYYSTDGGRNWATITLPGTADYASIAKGKLLVAFDPGDPTHVYVHVSGVGLYRSTSGVSAAFEAVADSPRSISCLMPMASGDIWMCEYRIDIYQTPFRAPLRKLSRAGGWTSMRPMAWPDQVAVDPRDPRHIVVMGENGELAQTRDGGATWRDFTGAKRRGDGEIGWLSNNDKPMYVSMLQFDPAVPNRLWMTDGVGISWSTPPAGEANDWVWHDRGKGDEALVGTTAFSFPGIEAPFLLFWDKPIWRLDQDRAWSNNWSYPLQPGEQTNLGMVTIGHCLDQAIDDPDYLVAVVGQANNMNGYSEDGGRNWRRFPNSLPGDANLAGGWMAVSNRDNMVYCPGNNGKAVYSKDGGKSWSYVSFGGHASIGEWVNAYYVVRQCVTADKGRPGVFACLVNNISHEGGIDRAGRDIVGVWVTEDGGVTWARRFEGVVNTGSSVSVSTDQFWQARLCYVPGCPRELLYAQYGPQNFGNKLLWSRDDGASWTDMNNHVREVRAYGFGKPAPGQTRPTLFLGAKVRGVKGIYMSTDWLATDPVLIAAWPNGSFCGYSWIEGDRHKFGRCYVMMGGNGAAMSDYRLRIRLKAR